MRDTLISLMMEAARTSETVIPLKMEAARTSETLINFYQTTQRCNPEDSHLHLSTKFHCLDNYVGFRVLAWVLIQLICHPLAEQRLSYV
jgi:hypothetical protein